MIWVKCSPGGKFTSPPLPPMPRLHKENSLLLILPTTQLQELQEKNIFANILFSSFSSPFRVLEIKPFVFNETFPCPREQYHLAICLPALILTQYKSEILRIFPFFSFKFLDFQTMLCTFTLFKISSFMFNL